jgi:hypothetical protein
MSAMSFLSSPCRAAFTPRIAYAACLLLASGCASRPWYWDNADRTRPFEQDRGRCLATGYLVSQSYSGLQAGMAQVVAFENCMAAVGWFKVAGVPSSPSPQPAPNPSVASAPAATSAAAPAMGERIGLMGGADRSVYLGCVSCPSTDPESIFNAVGAYGSRVSQTSILNPISPYGSAVSALSACSATATRPPVVISSTRGVIGSLTLNPAAPGALSVLGIVEWLRRVCAGEAPR